MSSALIRRALIPRATTGNLSLHSLSSSSSSCAASTTSDSLSSSNPDDEETAVCDAVNILVHHRGKSRWSTLAATFPSGFTPRQVSQILLQIPHNPRVADAFFKFAIKHSLSSPPTLHCYATLIHILARTHLNTRAQIVVREAIRVSGSEDVDGSDELGHKLPKLFRELVETYRVGKSSPVVFDLLIRSFLEVNKVDPCLEIVRLLRSRGFCLHVKTCNALISKVSRLKGSFLGYDLYRELFFDDDEKYVKPPIKCRVLPNVHTFNELMLAFHRIGLVDMVEELWIEMSRLEIRPKVCSYSILMAAYCEQGDMEKAQTVWEELRSKGLKPDMVAYNTMIDGYCRLGEVAKAEELYKDMGLSGLQGTCVTYQHLLNGYCFAGDADSAMLVYKDMHMKGFSPDKSSVDWMIRLLCDKKSPSDALEFFMNVMRNADFVARETSYESLIKGLCGEGKMEEALNLQAQMVVKGFRPNSHIYGAFIDGYIKQGKPDIAERLKKEMMALTAQEE